MEGHTATYVSQFLGISRKSVSTYVHLSNNPSAHMQYLPSAKEEEVPYMLTAITPV
ncbi:hypothetical protein [Bacillus cereus]